MHSYPGGDSSPKAAPHQASQPLPSSPSGLQPLASPLPTPSLFFLLPLYLIGYFCASEWDRVQG